MSPTTYVNTDSQERVWPGLSAPDGSTLSLEAGESVELSLPADFSDAYLKPKPAAPAAPVQTAPKPPLTPTPPASIAGGSTSSQEGQK